MDELERAGRALRDAVVSDTEPGERVRARARTLVRRRRMFVAGSVATAVIATSIGIAVARNGDNGLGVHTIAPAGSSTTRTPITRPVLPSVATTTAARNPAMVQPPPLLAFADALHGWRLDPNHEAVEHTADGGRTWTAQLHAPSLTVVSGVFTLDDRDVFALVADAPESFRLGSRLMRTIDGAHWRRMGGTGLPGPLVLVSFVDSNHGWGLSLYGDLVTTRDGGDHWSAMSQPVDATLATVASVCLAASGSGWAVTGNAVYRSDDDGATWRRQVKLPVAGGLGISLACSGPHVAYSSFDVGAGQHIGGFIRSDDGGAHWRPYTEDVEAGVTTVTASGFPENQFRGEPVAMASDGTLTFTTGCAVCSPAENWVVVASPADRFVVGHFDRTTSQQTLLLAASATDATNVFAAVQTFAADGTGPRTDSLYASSDGGHTWRVRWTGP